MFTGVKQLIVFEEALQRRLKMFEEGNANNEDKSCGTRPQLTLIFKTGHIDSHGQSIHDSDGIQCYCQVQLQ